MILTLLGPLFIGGAIYHLFTGELGMIPVNLGILLLGLLFFLAGVGEIRVERARRRRLK